MLIILVVTCIIGIIFLFNFITKVEKVENKEPKINAWAEARKALDKMNQSISIISEANDKLKISIDQSDKSASLAHQMAAKLNKHLLISKVSKN